MVSLYTTHLNIFFLLIYLFVLWNKNKDSRMTKNIIYLSNSLTKVMYIDPLIIVMTLNIIAALN